MTPVPEGVFFMANQPVMVVRSDKGHLLTTDKLSDFWQTILRLCWGSGAWKADCPDSYIAYCRLPLIRKSSIKPGQMLAFARYRRALSYLCGAGYS